MSTTLAQHNFLRHIQVLQERLAAMLWHYYDRSSPLEGAFCALVIKLMPGRKVRNLFDALPYRTVGMTTMDLLNTMAHLGFEYRRFRSAPGQVDARLLPCLFVGPEDRSDWPDVPLLLLEKDAAKREINAYDCAQGRVRNIALTGAEARGRGTCFTFLPLSDERRATSATLRGASGFSWFRALLTRFYPLFAQILVAGFFLHMLSLGMPLFIMLVYDRVISSHAPDTLFYLIPGVGLALLFEVVLRQLRGKSLAWLATRLDVIVTTGVFAHLIGLPSSVIEQTVLSSQVARIKTFEYVRDFFSGPVFLSLLEAPFSLVALGVIALVAGPVVLVPVLAAGVFLGLFYVMWRPVKFYLKLAAKATSRRQQFVLETFEKLEALQQHGLGELWYETFRQLSGREYYSHFRLNQYGTAAELVAHTMTLLAAMGVLVLGTQEVWDGRLTVGGLLATMILVWRVLTPFYSLCTMIPRLEQLRKSIKQINQLMDTDVEDHANKARARQLKGGLKLERVGLAYEGLNEPLLTGLTLEVVPGEIVMVNGAGGSGKTTLMKLLLGLYDATQGTLRLDGFDLRQLDVHDLRRQIAYVPQVPDFFEGSLIENLQLAKPAAQEAELWQALRMSDMADVVQGMKDKLDTRMGSGEAGLESEFAYKLSLSRAYLKNANLLLVDEQPGTLMDTRTGELLQEYVRQSRGKRTVVMVCDRPEFLALADKTVTLNRFGKPEISTIKHHKNQTIRTEI